MNDLSWIIYAADVVPKIGDALVDLTFFLALIGGTIICMWSAAWMNGEAPKPIFKTYFSVLLICAVPAALTPSHETILMIAASELGETVATSEEGAQALDDIRTIVTDELARLAGRDE